MEDKGARGKQKSTNGPHSTGNGASHPGKPNWASGNSTKVDTSNSPAFSLNSRNIKKMSRPKPFNLKHVINSEDSAKMSGKVVISNRPEGLLSSNHEIKSLINANQSPIRMDPPSSGEIEEVKMTAKQKQAQSTRISQYQYQPTSVLKSLQVDQSFSSQRSGSETYSKYFGYADVDSINPKTSKTTGNFRFISQSVTSSKRQLNPKQSSGNWNQFNDMSIDKSYSIINLNEEPHQDIQFSLKREMAKLASSFGFEMIDFRVNYLLFVFVTNLNACFSLSSKVKNYCRRPESPNPK